MHQRIYLTLILLVAFALSACQPPLPTTIIKPDSSVVMEAEAAEKSGDYLLAAQRYFALASTSKGKQQALFYLRSALSYWQIRQYEQVLTSLENVNRQLLSSPQKVDAALLEAEVALAQSHPEHIVTALSSIDLQYADATQHKRTLELKISAYELTQNWLEKVNAHIELSPLLTEAGREQNQRAIWQSLMSLTPQALDLFNPGMAPAIDSGWFSLAYIIKSYQSNPDALTVAIEDWHRNYPNHPAKPDLYKKSLETGTRLPQQLNNIAILLPETGPYAAAARAIKQGIIAAHYTAHSDTGLHFLDIKTDKQTGQSNVWQQYQHAIELDASLVLGPLDKVSIQVLANAEELPVPVLALNRLTNNVQKYNLFQFGLAPEDDAIAVANYATRKGFQRAVILSPDSDWGKRVASTFSDQWLNSGGVLLNQGNYNESDSDFSSVIKPLFGLDASKERHTTL
ncbi:MAG: penicillin-binding protein activator, partial [Gammaproteobacteria bacterium]|nr:penicillin-binding protein activator [Gammaproteobacteria bacterium]